MKELFYFMAIVPILVQVWSIINSEKSYELIKKSKKIEYHQSTKEEKIIIVASAISTLWIFIGIFTSSQWILFIIMLFLAFETNNKLLRLFDNLITLFLLIIILINSNCF